MNKSVVFYGWYGPGNVGDELLLCSLVEWARRNALEPVIVSYDAAYTKRIHGVKAVDVEDFPAIVNAVADSEACILGGGGIFQTHTEFSYAGLFHFGCSDVSVFARPTVLAQQLGVPSVLIGQGVGPLIHEEARGIVREVFNAAEVVSVRDKASLDLLKFIGVKREVPMAPDLVWAFPTDNITHPAYKKEGRKRVAFVIRPWFKIQGFEERLIAAIKAVIDPRRHTLVWIPFQNHSISNRSASDKGFIQQCMGKLGPEWHQELIEEDRPERVIDALSGCDAVVAMRLHAQILAFKLGKPTLSIEYDKKMAELSVQVQQDATLRIRPEDDLDVWQRALEHLRDLDTYPGFNFEKVHQLKSEAEQHFRLLDKFIAALPNIESSKRLIRLQDINWFEYWLIYIGKQIQARTNQLIVERDGLIASLNQAVAERDGQISKFNIEMIKIRQSISWRITSPVRVAKNLVVSPKRTAYAIIRSLFWRLPAGLRQALHCPRHAFVRFVRRLPSPPANRDLSIATTDLSWEEFRNKIISIREKYKGIFVQDLVIDWNIPLYQRPQHISAALGALGYLVIYRTDNWAGDNVNGFREVCKNVWITNRYEVEEIQGVVRSFYSTAYANTPELLLRNGRRGVLVYEYIDHIDPEISGDRENINRLLSLKNFAFSGGADFIVASARKLYEEAVEAVGKDKAILVPNGVDTAHYRDPIHQRTSLPSSLIQFKKKNKAVVGYFGALAPWLWYECIEELCKRALSWRCRLQNPSGLCQKVRCLLYSIQARRHCQDDFAIEAF
ncbi:MAG: polysaccharide pyruvyl transferase family protein [Methylococcaceae bacterium]|nr:polysaccharide pyruvyl transferase family protein [Methylococcaceae bacterium]